MRPNKCSAQNLSLWPQALVGSLIVVASIISTCHNAVCRSSIIVACNTSWDGGSCTLTLLAKCRGVTRRFAAGSRTVDEDNVAAQEQQLVVAFADEGVGAEGGEGGEEGGTEQAQLGGGDGGGRGGAGAPVGHYVGDGGVGVGDA